MATFTHTFGTIRMVTYRKTKILIIEPVSDLGGVSQYILSIVRYLPSDKYEIHVAASGNGPLFDLLNREGVSVHRMKIDYSFLTLFPATLSFRRFIKRERFDLIHAHTTKAGFLCSLSNLGVGTQTIYSGHCFRFSQKKQAGLKTLFLLFERFICHSSNYITVVGQTDYNLGISLGLLDHETAAVIPMSIDVNKFLATDPTDAVRQRKKLGLPGDAFVVGMIGRLALPRDPTTFLNAAAILSARLDNIYFLWVGDGNLREEMLHQAAHLGLDKKLVITGWMDSEKIPQMLSAIDVLLNATKIESMGIAILEAMAARTPIVAANVGGIPDIIKDGITGWVFESGDYEKAALIVENIYRSKAGTKNIIDAAFTSIVAKYSPKEKIAREFDSIYERVMRSQSLHTTSPG